METRGVLWVCSEEFLPPSGPAPLVESTKVPLALEGPGSFSISRKYL